MKNIAVLFPCRKEVKEKLKKAAPGCRFAFLSEMNVTERAGLIQRANAIMGEPSCREIQAARELEWLQLSWSGTDKYTKQGNFPEKVILTNATGVFGKSIAEWLLGTLLSLYKRLPAYRDRQSESKWQDMGQEKSLYGKRVLIVGAGDIGQSFARLLVPFQTETIGIRRRSGQCPPEFKAMYAMEQPDGVLNGQPDGALNGQPDGALNGQPDGALNGQPDGQQGAKWNKRLDEELRQADVVALCLPDTKETEGLMNLERLRLLKEDAVLLNVGRGKTLVTKDLLTVLAEGRIYGVGLDVFDTEPLPPESPLWTIERVLITPHIAGQGLNHLEETYEQITELFIENAGRYDRGEKLLNIVDKQAGYRA